MGVALLRAIIGVLQFNCCHGITYPQGLNQIISEEEEKCCATPLALAMCTFVRKRNKMTHLVVGISTAAAKLLLNSAIHDHHQSSYMSCEMRFSRQLGTLFIGVLDIITP